MRTDVTYLGPVRRVVGAKVLVEVSPALPSANPIIEGHLYRLGQVGTFVRIPLGYVNLFGIVATVGASELTSYEGLPESAHGQRWMEVQLIGESVAGQAFQRGVSLFPTIDDEVHIVVEKDLAIIYGAASPAMVEIGWHVASESLRATIDIDRIVTRHAAIVGSTGSGKSNTVAAILKSLTDGEFPNARIVIVDPHGEYGAALAGSCTSLRNWRCGRTRCRYHIGRCLLTSLDGFLSIGEPQPSRFRTRYCARLFLTRRGSVVRSCVPVR